MKDPTQAPCDRRTFLKTSGHLIIGFNLFPFVACQPANTSEYQSEITARGPQDPDLIDSWIRLDQSGKVTVLTGKQELGQGIRVALMQMAAEELDVPLDICDIINGDTGLTANEGYTAGSNSVEGSGSKIRQAAAEARMVLVNMASEKWNTDPAELMVTNGIISNQNGEKISYWDLLDGKYIEAKISGKATQKPAEKHIIVGKPFKREDIKNLVLGKNHFVHDLRLTGMVHARVLHPPSYGAKLVKLDQTQIQSMPGVLKVIVDGSFIAVVAEREFQAVKARQKMQSIAEWKKENITIPQASLFENIKSISEKPELVESAPDYENNLASSAIKLKAEYLRPYHMHASTGPSCAVAEWKEDNLTVWSPTQGVYPLRNTLTDLFQIPAENIRCIGMPGSGCYGHNGADDVSAEAALIAKAFPDRPVRLQWMREDEHQWEPYGSAMIMEIEAGISEAGKIAAWDTKIWSDTHSTRPNGRAGHYVSARHLANPFEFQKGGFSRGSYRNGIPYYVIPAKRLHLYNFNGPLRTSALRGLGAYGNIFALESFMDELAFAAKLDPIAFRLANLEDERARAVLIELREKSGWDNLKTGKGVAFAKYKNSASYFAVVAEVSVDPQGQKFHLEKLTGVIESGQCINPDGLKNQTEGGMIQSASWTLLEEVRFDESGILSTDWNTYPILRTSQVPNVEVHVINRPDQKPLGAGEAAQGPVAAAIANAVFSATGSRVRNLPITPEKIAW